LWSFVQDSSVKKAELNSQTKMSNNSTKLMGIERNRPILALQF
jgi:hypothetical protein